MKQLASLTTARVHGVIPLHLFVRAEPHHGGKDVGVLDAGVTAQLTGNEKDGWVELFFGVPSKPGKPGRIVRGWAYAKYLDIRDDPVFLRPVPPPPDIEPIKTYPDRDTEIPTIVDSEPKFRCLSDAALSLAAVGLIAVLTWAVWSLF